MNRSNQTSLALSAVFLLFFGLSQLPGCKDNNDHDPCEGLPADSCNVDSTSCPGPIGEWQSLGLDGETIISIAIHPTDPRIIYAGSQFDFSAGHLGKLFKSTDCGSTWDTLIVGQFGWNFWDLEFDPSNSEIIYACVGGYLAGTGIMRSTNGGQTWEARDNGIFIDGETWVYRMTIDQGAPNNLYAFTKGYSAGGLFVSGNQGESWNEVRFGDSSNDYFEWCGALWSDPKGSGTLYVGALQGLFRSYDHGTSWSMLHIFELAEPVTIRTNDKDSKIIVGLWGKGFSTSIDSGATWQPLQTTFDDSLFSELELVISNTNPPVFFVTIGSYVSFSADQGATWNSLGQQPPTTALQVRSCDPPARLILASGMANGIWAYYR